MPGNFCCLRGCTNKSDETRGNPEKKHIIYHIFPVDEEIREKWFALCRTGREGKWKHKRVCSEHFNEEDYERDLKAELLHLPGKRRLKPSAVPTPLISVSVSSPPEVPVNPKPEKIHYTDEEIQNMVERLEILEKEKRMRDLKEGEEENRVHEMRQKISELNRELRALSRKVQSLKKKYTKEKENKDKILKALSTVLTKNQLDIIFKKKMRAVWTSSEISVGFTLRYLSKRAYSFIRDKLYYPLPGLSTLEKWASKIDMSSGLQSNVLHMMELQAQTKTTGERLCVLAFDEMKVARCYEYDRKNDEVVGPHNYLQVVMVRGLCDSWKQPVYAAPDKKMTKATLENIVTGVHNAGYRVISCVSDMGGGNVGLWKELGVSEEYSYFLHPITNEKIYMFADAPHAIKLVRNWLLDGGFTLENGTILTKKPLEHLSSSGNSEVSSIYGLKPHLLEVKKTERQRVSDACKLLSLTVAMALRRYLPNNEDNSLALADFIQTVNDWFDVMNSYVKYGKIPPKSGYGIHLEKQNEILDKMERLMNTMRCTGKAFLQMFQKGIIMSIKSLKLLLLEINEAHRYRFILTHRLNQDLLENFFSQIRTKGGLHDHPSPLYALHRIKLIMCGKSSGILCRNANTIEQGSQSTKLGETTEFLATAMLRKMKIISNKDSNVHLNEEGGDEEAEIQKNQCHGKTGDEMRAEIEEDGLKYVAGWVAMKFKNTYPSLGCYTYQLEDKRSEHDYGLKFQPSWIQQLSFGGLTEPSQQFFSQIKVAELHFQAFHGHNDVRRGRGVVSVLVDSISRTIKVPKEVLTLFIRLRLYIRIKYLNYHIKLKQNSPKKPSKTDSDESRKKGRKYTKIVT